MRVDLNLNELVKKINDDNLKKNILVIKIISSIV
jgi:hypothetical protein